MANNLLNKLLVECEQHYERRGFPKSAIMYLKWVLLKCTDDDKIKLKTPFCSYSNSVKRLHGHFLRPENGIKYDIKKADAVFAFACGYRIKQWTGKNPDDDAEVRTNRISGSNNEALAKKVETLKQENKKLDLYLQFEIAHVIKNKDLITYTSQRKDQGTKPVLQEFMHYARHEEKPLNIVLIVAHRHHVTRCRLLLKKEAVSKKIRVMFLPIEEQYDKYDDEEAQPRAMSPQEFIVNDFCSMAAMRAPSE